MVYLAMGVKYMGATARRLIRALEVRVNINPGVPLSIQPYRDSVGILARKEETPVKSQYNCLIQGRVPLKYGYRQTNHRHHAKCVLHRRATAAGRLTSPLVSNQPARIPTQEPRWSRVIFSIYLRRISAEECLSQRIAPTSINSFIKWPRQYTSHEYGSKCVRPFGGETCVSGRVMAC